MAGVPDLYHYYFTMQEKWACFIVFVLFFWQNTFYEQKVIKIKALFLN